MSSRIRCGTALIALVCASALLPVPASAQLSGELEAARRRATRLEERITRAESEVRSMQSQLRTLAIAVGREQGGLEQVQDDLSQTKARLADTRTKLDQYGARVRTRVRAMYQGGPLQLIGVVLGSQSVGEFVGRVSYASRLARHDQDLVLQMRRVRAELRDIEARQRTLERRQRTRVTTLRSRRAAMTAAFARQQTVLADLAAARAEAIELIAELQDRLDLGGLKRVAGHGMTISYGEWGREFLGALGAPASRSNQVAVIAWEAAEGTQATWNPLATTYSMPGSTTYNSHGVRNYATKGMGIEASEATLGRPGHGYDAIVGSLKQNADAMETARAINRSDWCRGCAGGSYVTGFIPAVEQYYDRYGGR